MNEDDIYATILDSAFGLSLGAIWQHLGVEVSGCDMSYLQRKELFLRIMGRLLSDGWVKLAREGELLAGDSYGQLELLRTAWPNDPGADDLDGFGHWFLIDAPAGVVWIAEDGVELWT
ncbi:DUF596 domain-containing protein [Lysobacter firmicutimachus]|uniref:DUF596 domain-containing protein n=1 Tax=Lysobacter firmicutimachus TaxID=1792846 RepID=A0AAU8MXS0_9GAMM